jgi:molybdopterin-guanine dinucleotide biosynthesis protein A
MGNRAALVLAGGGAKRFQTSKEYWQDKALVEINGKSLLVHVIENIKGTVGEIVVCVNDEQRLTQYKQLLDKQAIENVRFVVDQQGSPVKGPLLAIASGLQTVNAQYCLIVPTDMPFLKTKVADYLLVACKDYNVAVPIWPDGKVETLLMGLERQSCAEIAQTLCALNRANADGIIRGSSKLHLVSPLQQIHSIDTEFRSFVNINSQEDLANLKTRSIEGRVKDDVCFHRENLQVQQLRQLSDGQKLLDNGKFLEALPVFADCACRFEVSKLIFWAAISEEKLGETQLKLSKKTVAKQTYAKAAENYQKEAEAYTANDCTLLAERALADKAFCEEKVGA